MRNWFSLQNFVEGKLDIWFYLIWNCISDFGLDIWYEIGYPILLAWFSNLFPIPEDPTTSLFVLFFHGFHKKSHFGAQPIKKIWKYNLRCPILSFEWGATVVERLNAKGSYPMMTFRHIGKETKWDTKEEDKVC